MNLLLELSLLFFLCLVGELLSGLLPFPMPASVLAMALLFLLLLFRCIKKEQIERSASFLLKYLALFLVPAGVSLLESASLLSGSVWQLIVICLVTTPLTLLAGYYSTSLLIRLVEKRKENRV